MNRQATGTIKVIAAAILFSLNPTLFSLVDVAPMEIFWVVNVWAAAAIATVMLLHGRLPEVVRTFQRRGGSLALLAVVFSLNNVAFIYAIRMTTIANSVLTHYMAPIFVFLLGAFILGERVTKRRSIALVVGLLGVLSLVAPAVVGSHERHAVGILAGLGSAAFFGLEIVLKKMLVADLPPLPVVLLYVVGSVVVMVPFMAWEALARMTLQDGVVLAISGIVSSAIGIGLFTVGLRDIRAQQASVISYIEPLGAILWGIVVLGDVLTLGTILGGILVLGGTYLILADGVHTQDGASPQAGTSQGLT